MADDDDEDFVTIGTAFDIPEKDEKPRKQFDKHEQVVVDSKGRRRFHGAFTGGFSAGYFNSVGSKEGWTPSTFLSSRSNRAKNEGNTRRPEDFMDDEDFGDHGIAPKMFMTKEDFTPVDRELNERKRVLGQAVQEGVLRSAVPGGIPVDDLIIPSRLSMGVQLLQRMGWKAGQGIGEKEGVPKLKESTPSKKVYGCEVPINADVDTKEMLDLLAPKDVQPISFTPKENVHGVGYKGISPGGIFSLSADNLSKSFKPTGKERRGIRGQAFGVGAFEEEDENVYGSEDMSEYDFALSSEREQRHHGWSGPPKKDKIKGAIAGFQKASKPTAINKIFRPPLLPANFVPGGNFDNLKLSKTKVQGGDTTSLNSNARALLLGERVPIKHVTSENVKPNSSMLEVSKSVELRSTGENSRLKSIENPGGPEPERPRKPSRWDTEGSSSIAYAGRKDPSKEGSFQPFLNDPEKQHRYDSYLESKRFGKNSELKYSENLTEWEKERELEEFARASILFRPMSSFISSRFTRGTDLSNSKEKDGDGEGQKDQIPDCEKAAKLGFFGKLTRTTYDWFPSSVLCKRFNVPHPYPGSRFTGTPGRGKRKSSDWVPVNDKTVSDEDYVGVSSSIRSSRGAKPDDLEDTAGVDCVVQEGLEDRNNKQQGSLGKLDRTDKGQPSRRAESSQQPGPLSCLNDKDDKSDRGTSSIGISTAVDESKDRPSLDFFKAIFSDSDDHSESEPEEDIQKDENTEVGGNAVIDKSSCKERPQHLPTADLAKKENANRLYSIEGQIDFVKKDRLSNNSTIRIVSDEGNEMERAPMTDDDVKTQNRDLFGPFLPPEQKENGTSLQKSQFCSLKDEEVSSRFTAERLRKEAERDNRRKKEITSGRDDEYSRARRSEKKKKKKKSKSKKKKKKSHKTSRRSVKSDVMRDSSSEWSSGSDDAYEGASRSYLSRNEDSATKDIRQRERLGRQEKIKQYQEDDLAGRRKINNTLLDNEDSNGAATTNSANSGPSRVDDDGERVPSARELFRKLKEQGLSIKRKSAADFM